MTPLKIIHVYNGNQRWRRSTSAFLICLLPALPTMAQAEEQGIWKREKLSGEWGGVRTALQNRGVEIGIAYIGETLSILRGGLQRDTSYEGRADVQIDTDLEKLIGWTGGKTHVRAFHIHKSQHNAADFVGSIADPSNIDATPTNRLFTAWFQQEFGKVASIRVGQLAADDEFLTSTTAGGQINGTFGWAAMVAANLPSGGAAYPLATPGVRLQINLTESFSVLGGLFSGDPAGKNCGENPQHCNKHGTTFSFSGGAFWIGEAQYQVNQDKDAKGLAAAYKIGVWHHTGNFADQHFGIDATGAVVTLAAGPENPLLHRNNRGVYGVIDQMLWRGAQSSASVFVRGGFSPSDRNLISWYIDGGVGLKGLIPGRADDTLTLGVAHAKISKDAVAFDQDTLALNGPPYPIRNAETVYELSYIAQLAPWWTLQPDVQYIVRPGGNVPDPNDPTRTVGNALVIGARTTISF
ncbi:MAG: carbohydrate porin [Rhizobiales bacterium]|nr:carbohydrate porin [Hyphomicrobiales bacterium]